MHRPRTTLLFGLTLLLSGAPAGAQAPAVEKPAAPAEKLKNTLRWRTTDVDVWGYDVFRAESEAGPFTKINDQLIDGRIKNRAHEFSFVDDTIAAGKDYWYYVEAIDLMGKRTRLSAPMKAAAKGAAPGPVATASPKQ